MNDLVVRLREYRESHGLSQHAVGQRMGTTQPAVARLENGGVDPRLGTVQRYAEAVGTSIDVVATPRVDVRATAEAVAGHLRDGAFDVALREVIQLVEDLARLEPGAVAEVLRSEPPSVGDRRFDALLAAACERAAHGAGVPAPGWAAAPSRFLERWWFPIEDILGRLPSGLACHALASSPPEFAARGVFIDPRTLDSV